MTLPERLDALEAAAGAAPPLPSTDGWELVVGEAIGYLVDDDRRWDAVRRLKAEVGLDPAALLAADDEQLLEHVVGMKPADRVARLRECAELRLLASGSGFAGKARWTDYPGIGKPGAERIALFSGESAVLGLDANALRVLLRLGYGERTARFDRAYRTARAAAAAELPSEIPAVQRAHQLLRRHGQTVCRRTRPGCAGCAIAGDCPSRGTTDPLM